MKTKGKSIFFICLAMIVSGVILFSVIYSGQMVSAAQRVETYKDNGEDESEMTQESIQSQEKTVREQAEYMEELEEEQNIAHSEILEVMGVRNALAVKMNPIERALQTMTLTKSPQKMFAAYYADGTFNGQESVLYLNQEVVWCLEPSELVGNVGKGITYALADPGDAAQWLQNRYGWSWNKINNLAKAVCFAKQYFGDENPIGEQITYADSDGNLYNFTIVGIYEYNAALFGKVDTSVPEKDRYTTMFIPIQTCFKLMGKDQSGYTNFNLMVNSLADIDQATTDVTNFFEEKYANNENFHVTTYNMASDMGMINTVINVITIAVSGIALISLIVGGVGVMNIMLVSITERTREIGVRMALGAKRSTIRMQFVIEAIVLCIFGGMIGILIGVFNGFVLGKAAEFVIQNMYSEYSSYIIMSVRPSLSAIVLSLFFSMLTGVFFGYYPANKAAKMEVIDALRYE